jgi:hypothetical protein
MELSARYSSLAGVQNLLIIAFLLVSWLTAQTAPRSPFLVSAQFDE